jgi:hypothetical protein
VSAVELATKQFFAHEVNTMRPLAAQKPLFEPPFPVSTSYGAGLNHLLLAIGRAMSPPVVHMRSTFQPMRVIVVQPDLNSTIDQAAQWGCETPHLLPPAARPDEAINHNEPAWQQRIVQGEILSDENGRLYEKLGRHIRPVRQLASGPSGELVEMFPAERKKLRVIPHPAKVVTNQRTAAPEKPEPTSAMRDAIRKRFVSIETAENDADRPGHRKLFTDPGQWRVVTWGEFKEILAPQLAHPERLRDTYRLPCYVQVVETDRDVTIEELAKEFSTANGRPKPLYFLTDELAVKLELTQLLPPLPAGTSEVHATPNLLSAHQRVFRLLVANDPTGDVGNFKKQSPDPTTATKTSVEESSPAPTLKTSIPIAFVKDWEFKLSREEASYDMNNASFFTAFLRFARRLRLFKQHREFRKWQILLSGRNPDEQLWHVRPPANGLGDPIVRDWVKKTLQLAGFESDKMLVEWEIFWRRKGQR